MTLDRDRPEILTPPEHPPACCTQQTITVPPDVAAKTRAETRLPVQRHTGGPTPGAPAPSGLRHRQGPRQQQHRPRLVPAHGPDPPHALARLPAGRPQPAHPERLERPPGRQRPPRRSRPAARKPGAGAARPSPPPPQRRHNPAQPATIASTAGITKTRHGGTTCCPEQPGQGSNQPASGITPSLQRPTACSGHIRKMSGLNVNMDTGET